MSLRIHPAGTKVFPLNNTGLSLGATLGVVTPPPSGGTLQLASAAQLPIGAGGNIMSVDVTPDGVRYCRTDTNGAYRWDATKYNGNGGWKYITNATSMDISTYQEYYHNSPMSIAAADTDSNTMYMAMWNGMMKSTNGGDHWDIQTTPTKPDGSLYDWTGDNTPGSGKLLWNRIAIDPVNANHVLYASTNDGLFRTTNGGSSWSKILNGGANQLPDSCTTSVGFDCVTFDPSSTLLNSGTITSHVSLMVDGDGIYHSSDGGQNWTKDSASGVDFTQNIGSLEYRSDGTLFLLQNNLRLIYRRDGSTWTDISPQNDSANSGILSHNWGALAIDPHRPGHLVALSGGTLKNDGTVVISYDSGDNWIQPDNNNITMINDRGDIPALNDSFNPTSPNYQGAASGTFTRKRSCFDTDPQRATTMYMSEGVGVWELEFGGTDAVPTVLYRPMSRGIEQLVGQDVIAVPAPDAVDGVAVIVGSYDRGTHRNIDRTTWPTTHYPMEFDSTWNFTSAPGTPTFIVASTGNHQDAPVGKGVKFSGWSDDSGLTWTEFGTLPGLINPAGPTLTYPYGDDANPPVAEPDPHTWGYGIIVVGKNTNHMIWIPASGSGSDRKVPHYTIDRGDHWTPVQILDPTGTPYPGGKFNSNDYATKRRSCVADPVIEGVFYTFLSAVGLFKTTDAGATWNLICDASSTAAAATSGFPFRGDQTNAIKLYAPAAGELWFLNGQENAIGPNGHNTTSPNVPLAYSLDSGVTWTTVNQIASSYSMAFGPPLPNATGSTKTIVTRAYTNGDFTSKGFYASIDNGQTWTNVGAYPAGIIGTGNASCADPLHPGRFYAAYGGIGWIYFDIQLV